MTLKPFWSNISLKATKICKFFIFITILRIQFACNRRQRYKTTKTAAMIMPTSRFLSFDISITIEKIEKWHL
jgi:hypothetical protein